MFEPLAVPAINRLLRTNSWALERLRPHAGKTAKTQGLPGGKGLGFEIGVEQKKRPGLKGRLRVEARPWNKG